MARELQFGVDVLDSALFNANPTEWYAKAYLGEDVADNYRALPNIKTKTKLGYVLFSSLLKEATCDFENTPGILGAVEIDVETLAVMIEICQFEIEQSFLVEKLSKGATTWDAPEFMAHFWDTAAMEVTEEIELIRWTGDVDGVFGEDESFLALIDGYEKKLKTAKTGVTATFTGGTLASGADTLAVFVNRKGGIDSVTVSGNGVWSVVPTGIVLANVGDGRGATFLVVSTGSTPTIDVTGITVVTQGAGYRNTVVYVQGTTVNAGNILAEMAKVFAALPRRIRRRKDLLRWYVPPSIADLFRQVTAAANTLVYITKALDLTYLDIKIVVCDGMSDDTMVLTRKDNMIYAFDAIGDGKKLELVDMMKSVAEPKMRARTQLRLGFPIVNHEEIVFYAKP